MQDATEAMTPAELLECFNTLDPMRQGELLAYAQELLEELRQEQPAAVAATA